MSVSLEMKVIAEFGEALYTEHGSSAAWLEARRNCVVILGCLEFTRLENTITAIYPARKNLATQMCAPLSRASGSGFGREPLN